MAASDANHPNPFLFTGRRYDTETGLYYYRARYYNPSIGRFLQTDPIGYEDGMNIYAYCSNDPINSTDPSGCTQYLDREVDACPICGGERSDHYGGVYLDPPPSRKWRVDDPWGSIAELVPTWEYYEWTGRYKLTSWRGTAERVAAKGTIRYRHNGVRIVDSALGIAETVGNAMIGNWPGAAASGTGFLYGCIWGAVDDMILEEMNSLEMTITGKYYVKAFIEVDVYKRRQGLSRRLFGKWGKTTRWVEVKCGEGYNTLGLDAYDTAQHAIDAIGSALWSLPTRRKY